MEDPNPLNSALAYFLQQHGVPHTLTDEHIYIEPIDLKLSVFPIDHAQGGNTVQVSLGFEATHPTWPDVMLDTVLGLGTEFPDAVNHAIHNWLYSTFMVLTAFLRPQNPSTQTYSEEFTNQVDNIAWKVIASPLQTLGTEQDATELRNVLTANLPYQQLIPVFADQAHIGKIYWTKVFMSSNGEQEVLGDCWLNNEPWPAGFEQINSFVWPYSEDTRGFRQFIVFIRDDYSVTA
jgi:hypothetical protein